MKKYITYFSPAILLLAFAFMSFSSLQEQFTESFEALTVGSTSFIAETPLLTHLSDTEVRTPAMTNAFDTIELLSQGTGDSDRNLDNLFAPPVINVWYGDTQEFGNNGVPQAWCNIMGNITDDGTISSFTYTLNGGSAINLSIGPDNRRLVNAGDFNIDIAVMDLLPGANTVLISATDNDTPIPNTSTKTITINYTDGNVWPIPYSVDWSTLASDITKVNEVAHIVDGKFLLPAGGGIRTAEPGYDRLIAMADMTSTNYEVLVPVTIHTMPSNFGVGVLLRWKGHTDTPVTCVQPKCGYLPLGDIAWIQSSRLEFYQGNNVPFTPAIDVTYMMRTSVETDVATGNTQYRLKVWEQGSTEPVAWNLEQTTDATDEQAGSLMLISHKADVTFGNVMVTAPSLSISNVQTQLSNNNTEATVTWNTNQQTTSRVDYGPTIAYEDGFVANPGFVTSHSINLTGLTPDTIYQYKISGENSIAETVEKTGLVLSTLTSNIVSNDFCDNVLNPVWTFNDPKADGGSYTLVGSGTNDALLEIAVPSGDDHELWTSGIEAPHIIQPSNNADFELEVKMESSVSDPQYQQQGIIVKQDDYNFLRFEISSNNSNTKALSVILESATNSFPLDANIPVNTIIGALDIAPLYMRVKREGDQWTQSYSFDNITWTETGTFSHSMVVNGVGLFAGNAGGNPAHTAQFDYFKNLEDPITDEDGCTAQQAPVLASIGNQTVDEGNTLSLILTATDADGNDADIIFTEIGLPGFAQLTNNNDGTALLSIGPLLEDAATYPVTIIVTDLYGLTDNEEFDIVVTAVVSNIVSDDFCGTAINPVWTFTDPLDDGTLALTGSGTVDAFLEISVPSGSQHQIYNGINAPNLMQSINTADFEVEVKFESGLIGSSIPMQGILVKESDTKYLRFEFYGLTNATMAYVQAFNPNAQPAFVNTPIVSTGTPPLYMRVKRQGDDWIQSYSIDGTTFTEIISFTYALLPTAIGPYAGNAGGNPAHTAKIDYFLNLADPISAEDSCEISNLVSDDFCDNTLNPVWTFNDPLTDGTLALTGSGTVDAFLEIAVPAGLEHQLWKVNGIQAPHIIQSSNNTDFELEVKMESPLNAPRYQQQGVLIKQDDYNFLRFEISSDNSNTKALSATLKGTNSFPLTSTIPFNISIGPLNIAPIYMRVKREGNLWTQSYSFDGSNWTQVGSFTHAIVVSGVGLYSGNAIGINSPAHTAKFDYFKNLENPITDEDGCDICAGVTEGLIATWDGSESSDWNDADNWTPNVVPSECAVITIPATANTPAISGTLSVKDLVLNSGGNLMIPVGATLTIRGNLEMLSASNTYSGLVVRGSVAVYGDTRYHRYTNAHLNRNDLISPPLAGQSWTSFLTNDGSYNAGIVFNDGELILEERSYLFGPFEKGTTDDYVVYSYLDDKTLVPGIGYRVATNTLGPDDGEPLIFTGSILTGSVNSTIVNESTGGFPEWNLIGNPYPAYVDVNTFLNHVSPTSGVTNLSLLEDPSAAIYGYNADTGTSTGIWTITNLVEGPALIVPGQGFFVSSNDPSATLEFTKDMQVVGDSDDFIQGRTSSDTDFIKLKATTTNNTSSISVYFHDNGSTGLDKGYDAAIFGGSVPEFSLYSHLVQDNEGVPMVIQTLNTSDLSSVSIPLGVRTNAGEQVAFSIEDSNIPPIINVYLEDNETNTFTLLNNTNYVFTPSVDINGTGRFFLRFEDSALSNTDYDLTGINIYTIPEQEVIKITGQLREGTTFELFDMQGRMTIATAFQQATNSQSIDVSQLASGVYLIKIKDKQLIKTQKVIIK